MTLESKEIVCTVAFLIGINKPQLEKNYSESCGELLKKLDDDQDAKTLRYLCKLRTTLLRNYRDTDRALKYELKNLDRIEFYDCENIKMLRRWGIEVINVNFSSDKYTLSLTELIEKFTPPTKKLFPDWVNFKYITELFYNPSYKKAGVLKEEFDKYVANRTLYPFGMYINWNPSENGNILFNDDKFLKILYSSHDDTFDDWQKTVTASGETKDSIYNFIRDGIKIVVEVDCENCDAYKFFSVFQDLNDREIAKIEKIVLFDDEHTTSAWSMIGEYIDINVEHVNIERLMEQKSRVDHYLIAETVKSFYQDHVESFILFSSDSDFSALIDTLPNARYLVMYEHSKCSPQFKNFLNNYQVDNFAIDDFGTGKINSFKKDVLFSLLSNHINDVVEKVGINARELTKGIYKEARIEADEPEINSFFEKYIKTLKIRITDDGNINVEMR